MSNFFIEVVSPSFSIVAVSV